MSLIKPSATVALTDKAKRLKKEGRDIVSMSAGEPDFATPENICASAISALMHGDTHYVPSRGIPELRQGIFKKLKEVNRIPLTSAEQVMVMPGAKAGLMFTALALLSEGDECICPEPAWVSYEDCVTFAGGKFVPVPTKGEERFSITLEQLEDLVTDRTRLFILNSPVNPTGKVWTREELEMIADFVKKHDLLVLSDEIYEDLVYEGSEHISFASLPEMAERTLTLNGFSKAYAMTGWRLGYIAGPLELINAMLNIQQHSTTCATSFVQTAGIEAITNSAGKVKDMVAAFTKRREIFLDKLSTIEGVKAFVPEGTFYLFLDISSSGLKSRDFAESFLDKEGVAVTPGADFGESGEGYVRLSFAASEDDICECCLRLQRFLDSLKG
jgi:aspartate aminotransferase